MIVADASSIISLAINCMSSVLKPMNAEIFIGPAVYDEIVSRPIRGKRYALEAMRIQKLFSDGVVSVRETDDRLTNEILDVANSVFEVRNRPLRIIHRGEAEALALVKTLNAPALLIDERTTRMLIEEPDGLRDLLIRRTGGKVRMDESRLARLGKMVPRVPVIRSTEIAMRAYEKGILDGFLVEGNGNLPEAVLCALKFSGCAITWDEIDEYKRVMSEHP